MSPTPKPTPPPWRKHSPTSFMFETRGFSRGAIGMYVQLLDMYWASGGSLPAEPVLKRQLDIRTGADQKLLREVLEAFFRLDGETHRHPESDAQLAEINDRRKVEAERVRQYRANKRGQTLGTAGSRSATPAADDPDDF